MAVLSALAASASAAAASSGITFGGLLSAGGTILSGIAGAQAASTQASIAKMNAAVAEDNARRAITKGQQDQQDLDKQTAAILGEQLAIQGASGISVGGKSAKLTRKTARELGRKDALNVRQDAEVRAFNFKVDAASQRATASLAKSRGTSSLLGAFIGAGSSLASGAQSVTSKSKLRRRSLAA